MVPEVHAHTFMVHKKVGAWNFLSPQWSSQNWMVLCGPHGDQSKPPHAFHLYFHRATFDLDENDVPLSSPLIPIRQIHILKLLPSLWAHLGWMFQLVNSKFQDFLCKGWYHVIKSCPILPFFFFFSFFLVLAKRVGLQETTCTHRKRASQGSNLRHLVTNHWLSSHSQSKPSWWAMLSDL